MSRAPSLRSYPLSVFVFASEGYVGKASSFADACARGKTPVPVHIVSRLSSKAEDLLAVARYGVVEPLCLVAVDIAGDAHLRLTTLPTRGKLCQLLRHIQKHNGITAVGSAAVAASNGKDRE